MFAVPAIFRATISQNSQDGNLICIEERDHTIIEHIRGNQSILAIIEFRKSHLGIGVYNRLLINTSYAFHITDLERILSNEIAGMLGFDFSNGFLFFFGFFQCLQLEFRQHDAVLRNL